MYINHNLMASNVGNTLAAHYSNLQTSTQRPLRFLQQLLLHP